MVGGCFKSLSINRNSDYSLSLPRFLISRVKSLAFQDFEKEKEKKENRK